MPTSQYVYFVKLKDKLFLCLSDFGGDFSVILT